MNKFIRVAIVGISVACFFGANIAYSQPRLPISGGGGADYSKVKKPTPKKSAEDRKTSARVEDRHQGNEND